MSVSQIKNKRLYSLRMFCSSDHFFWKARRPEELLWADLIPGLPTPPHPSGNPEGGSCLQQDGCYHCSEGTRSDSSSAPAHSVSSRGTLGIFSELPSCRTEHRVQIFLPDVWLLSNVFFVSKGNKSTSDVASCTMNFALKHQWSTSKAQHHSDREMLFLGTPSLPRCAHQPGTHCPPKHLKTGGQIRQMWQIGMLKLQTALPSEPA